MMQPFALRKHPNPATDNVSVIAATHNANVAFYFL
jgi:hypothetical protein